MNQTELQSEWIRVIAPRHHDVRTELVEEAAEFLGIPIQDAWSRLEGAGERFREEWTRTVADPTDPSALTRFYNQSDTELFELIEWHASDAIHYRTLIVREFASRGPGRRHLDYGSGIGNDALVFADSGFDVTLADISDCLLAFAAWRFERRGFSVRTIDLKRDSLPSSTYHVVACLDVLEHILEPLPVVRDIHRSLESGGLLMMHAPFADDPEHPMHVVHRDVVTPRMRSLGFQPVDCVFPSFVRAAQLYEKQRMPLFERAAYFAYDNYLNNNIVGARLATIYRRMFKRPATVGSDNWTVASVAERGLRRDSHL